VSRAFIATVGILVATTAWLAPTRPSAEEKNLVTARNGAQVIRYTSERGGEGRAEKLIDEQLPPAGWASAEGSMPQEIIFRLPALSRFNTLITSAQSPDAPRVSLNEFKVFMR
jgi:hypothetical protein